MRLKQSADPSRQRRLRGRRLHAERRSKLVDSMVEAGADPSCIEACKALATEPYETMLQRAANSFLREYRRNPNDDTRGLLVDVFMSMTDEESADIPIELLRVVADTLRSIRAAETKGAAETEARKLRIKVTVAKDLDNHMAGDAYSVLRSAGIKDVVANMATTDLMKGFGSTMTADQIRHAFRAEKKRIKPAVTRGGQK